MHNINKFVGSEYITITFNQYYKMITIIKDVNDENEYY